MGNAIPLPEILGTCGCDARRGHKWGPQRHYSDCDIAGAYKAGEKAGMSVRYKYPDAVTAEAEATRRLADRSAAPADRAWLAGYDRELNMQMNTSYQAITWDYPLHIDTRFGSAVDLHIDPVDWFTKYLRSYATFEPWPELGFEEPWEKPLAFLYNQIKEDREPHGTFGLHDRSHGDDGLDSIRFRWAWEDNREWTEADTRKLHQALGLEDADGNPLDLVDDPQGRPAPRPQTVDDGILPLAGPGSAYTDRYAANIEFAMTYLVEALHIRATALGADVDPVELAAGLPGDRATIGLEAMALAKRWTATG